MILIRKVLQCCLLLSLCVLGFQVESQANPAYSHDASKKTDNKSWLSKVKDTTQLSRISLPGTHDSMSRYGGVLVQTQSMSLKNQLDSGIRALDIRVKKGKKEWYDLSTKQVKRDYFDIYHGDFYQKARFGDVLKTVRQFLKDHPSEFILINLQREGTKSDLTYITQKYIEETPSLFWKNTNSRTSDYWRAHGGEKVPDPQLKEIRGKIVLFSAGKIVGSDYGVPRSKAFKTKPYAQNEWVVKGTYAAGMYKKWKLVRKSLGWMNNNSSPPLAVNFFSASGVGDGNGSAPFFTASGKSDARTDAPLMSSGLTTLTNKDTYPDFPRKDCILGECTIYIQGINRLAYDRIGSEYKQHIGVVYMDFPGPDLINRIIQINYKEFDFGYSGQRWMVDISGDRKADYCREVGDRKNKKSYMRCEITNGVNNYHNLVFMKGGAGVAFVTKVMDLGYYGNRWFADVNGDERADYCRIVGDAPGYYLRCELSNGKSFSDYMVSSKLDMGHAGSRWFADVNGDGKADFCREVGDWNKKKSYLRCDLSNGKNFKGGVVSKQKLDLGYEGERWFADIDGNGSDDYCRVVGNKPNGTYLLCSLTAHNSFDGGEVTKRVALGYKGMRWFSDINGDGTEDYCSEVGNRPKSFLHCHLANKNKTIGDFKSGVSKHTGLGYEDARWTADVTGDGKAEYCRQVGTKPERRLMCNSMQ